MVIIPKASPNWKEGLLMVLLAFCIWKTDDALFRQISFLAVLLLLVNFIIVACLLFVVNILGLHQHIIIDKERKSIIDIKKNEFEFQSITSKKIPFNKLYIVNFLNKDTQVKRLILSESELLMLEFAIHEDKRYDRFI